MPITSYPRVYPQGVAGQPFDLGPYRDISLVNDNPRTAQVATYTVDSDITGDYTLEINGVSIVYTAPAGNDTTDTAAGIAAAINAEPLVSGHVSAAGSTADVVVTARIAGQSFTATESDDNLSLVQTTADDDADPVDFGRGVVFTTTDARGRVAAEGALTTQTYTLTPTAVADTTYIVVVTLSDGRSIAASFTDDGTPTVAEVVTGITGSFNAEAPASTVLATDDTTHVTFTAEIDGLYFTLSAGTDDAVAVAAVAETVGGGQADLNRALAGVAMKDFAGDPAGAGDDGTSQYSPGSNMTVREWGCAYVVVEDAVPDRFDDVYLGVGSGHEGLWRTTASGADYLKVDPKRARWFGSAGTNEGANIGILELL